VRERAKDHRVCHRRYRHAGDSFTLIRIAVILTTLTVPLVGGGQEILTGGQAARGIQVPLAAGQEEKPQASPEARADRLTAELTTEHGLVRIELYPKKTPLTVANFVNLARRGFYDGLTFYRVIAGATVEGGCPIGKGIAGPGYRFEDEFHPSLRHDGPGAVSMANVGPNTNGSRFLITLRAMPSLNGRNPVFGKVVEGMKVVRSIRTGETIESVVIKGEASGVPDGFKARVGAWNRILDDKYPAKTTAKPTTAAPPPSDKTRPPDK